MRSLSCLFGLPVVLSFALVVSGSPAQAQFGRLKDKLKDKAEKQVEKKVDQALQGSDSAAASKQEKPTEPAAQPGSAAATQPAGGPPAAGQRPAGAAGGTAASEDMTLYTKCDFVPGDKVIFYDDLSGEELGEFPSRWKLDHGVFEIAKQGGKNYIMCTDKGSIRPKIATGPLPVKYTIEMEFLAKGPAAQGHWFSINWLNAEGNEMGKFLLRENELTHLTLGGKELASKTLAAPVAAGVHAMRVMATKTTMKCYIDNERVANVPALEGFEPVDLRIEMDPYKDHPDNPMLVGAVRYAEGGKSLKEQLDEAGRIVTHGILFDSGSARIKAESYKTLADIGQLLTENSALRLSIEGHTDSDGADAANLVLSQDRANAVKTYLVGTYKVDGSRLEAKGWGEGKPIASNDTPEGKATNRRVELVRL